MLSTELIYSSVLFSSLFLSPDTSLLFPFFLHGEFQIPLCVPFPWGSAPLVSNLECWSVTSANTSALKGFCLVWSITTHIFCFPFPAFSQLPCGCASPSCSSGSAGNHQTPRRAGLEGASRTFEFHPLPWAGERTS